MKFVFLENEIKLFFLFHRTSLDVPYYFICPYDILEDDDYVYFKVHSTDQHLYAFKKSTGELLYRKFATVYDSGNQGTVTYLRSVAIEGKPEEFLPELSTD